MNNLRKRLILLALLVGGAAQAAVPDSASPSTLAESMKEATRSNGFEARMSISTSGTGESKSLKIAVVGQFLGDRERLLVRGISPKEIRNRFFAAERSADGRIRAIEYGENSAHMATEVDPFAGLFGSEMVLWDMFGIWWDWPKQSLGETERIAGRDCTPLHSQSNIATVPIREVVSCVDQDGRLSLKTQLFDGRHLLLRTIFVGRTMRRDSGTKAAKRLRITGQGGAVSEIDVYDGDEHYSISPETFAALESAPPVGKQ